MKASFFPCHMCGSFASDLLTPAYLADGTMCDFQQIVICKTCGLVYKNPVIPDLNNISYTKTSWGNGSTFRNRILSLTAYLSEHINSISPKTIMEVGPGPGWLAMHLQKLYPTSKYILLEASKNVAELTKQNLPNATVIPASIDDTTISSDFVDLAIVCGVDYLFADFKSGIEKMHKAISANGLLYIERNVFVEAEAYAGFPIRTYKDLFGQNVLMTTWFAVDQYKEFLSILFDIISTRSFFLDETDGHKCVIHGFLCKKKTVGSRYYCGSTSWYESNMASLERLRKEDAKACTPEPAFRQIKSSVRKALRFLRFTH